MVAAAENCFLAMQTARRRMVPGECARLGEVGIKHTYAPKYGLQC